MSLLLPVFLTAQVPAPTARLHGRVLDRRTGQPISGAHIRLINEADTAKTEITTSSDNGTFVFLDIGYRSYKVEVTFVGYAILARTAAVARPSVDLGDLPMSDIVIPQREVVVEGKVSPAVQKTDTTEFNARAFKTHPDATAEDLVTKMPGVTVDNNGSVKAQGEDVQQVLVDGKPFFGNDPTLALRNLPADAIEKIQIFDKMSDQAEFTGFDDGQSVKTINMITRPERRNQQFGKSYGGYGDEGRYLTGGGVNVFHGDMRLSLIGLSNNVNQQNFSAQDLLGVLGNTNQRGFSAGGGFSGRRGRGGGGGGGGFGGGPGGGQFSGGGGNTGNFLVGQQSGITTTNSIGTNYTDSWGSHLAINQSYFFNLTDGQNDQRLHRQYFGPPDSSTLYNENTAAQTRNYNHRIDTRVEYTADSSNSFIVQPRLYFQNNHSSTTLAGASTGAAAQVINQTETENDAGTSGYNLTDHVIFRHKFASPGRTISLDLGMGLNRKEGSGTLRSNTKYFLDPANTGDTTNQQTPTVTDGWSITPRLAYTEPVGGNSLVQLTYNPSYSKNESDGRNYGYDPLTGTYSIPDIRLTNLFENRYSTQNAGVGYRLRLTGLNLMGGLSYQVATLRGEQEFPSSSTVDRKFYDLLPNAMLTYNLAEHSNLRVIYRTSTKSPDISQLQNLIDNSNPLLLKTGNPDLKQSYTQAFISRFGLTSAEKGRSLFILFSVSRTSDFVGNSTITAGGDTVVLPGILLNRGTQLTVPVNLDGNWNLNSFVTYSLPVELIRSNLNLSSGFMYTRTPGLIGGSLNLADVSAFSAGTVVSSNVSEDVDFTLSYTANYSIARNTLATTQNSNYFYHVAGLKLNLIFWEGFVFRNETTNTLYNGLSGGFNPRTVLWNLSLAKKMFENQRGELKVGVTDLLNQNTSVGRTVTETYLEDTQNEVLGRYVMVTFTYTLR